MDAQRYIHQETIMRKLAYVLLALTLGWMPRAGAADLEKPLILVAKPELQDKLYGSTVLVVTPVGSGQHAGFIVNRPTNVTLGKVFPEHAPSQKIVDPIYLGGPIQSQVIFALVQRRDNPGGNSLEMIPGLFAAFDGDVVDGIIERDASRARFVAGLVAWSAGELQAEIKQGAWYVLEPDAALLMRKTDGLWEELVRRSVRLENTI
jgi:putative transcriptional regulator